MDARQRLSRTLVTVGGTAMQVGAIDPIEGALAILPGSGLFALGTFPRRNERRLVALRVWMFDLIAFGVGASWGLSRAGGLGEPSWRSPWWGGLMLPYPIGWSMGIWDRDLPAGC